MKKLVLLTLALGAGACVSSGKYEELSKKYKDCQASEGACVAERDKHKARVAELEQQLGGVSGELASEKEGRGKIEGEYKASQKELEELRRQNAEAQKRLAAFKALTAKFQKMIDSGKLKVGVRNGLMIVKLPSGILFASGKADLSNEGEVALTEVAGVLAELKDRKYLITGHTDNVPLARGKFKDNWELSTARALTVARWLMAQGVQPTQLAAAGYGEFDPVKPNDSDENKQENRRIEIVLMPNIEELPKMPELGMP